MTLRFFRRALSIATLAFLLLLIPLSAAYGQECELHDPRSEPGIRGVILTDGHVVDYKNGWDGRRDVAFSLPGWRGRIADGRADHARRRQGGALGDVEGYVRVANGVITALDVGSVLKMLTRLLEEHGEGVRLTVGGLYGLRPNGTISPNRLQPITGLGSGTISFQYGASSGSSMAQQGCAC